MIASICETNVRRMKARLELTNQEWQVTHLLLTTAFEQGRIFSAFFYITLDVFGFFLEKLSPYFTYLKKRRKWAQQKWEALTLPNIASWEIDFTWESRNGVFLEKWPLSWCLEGWKLWPSRDFPCGDKKLHMASPWCFGCRQHESPVPLPTGEKRTWRNLD